MAASWLLFSHTARNFFVDRAKKDLLAETETVEKQIGEMAQSDLFTERDDGRIKAAKIRTLGFALEQYTSINDAKGFLDEMAGAPVEKLDIRANGKDAPASLETLLSVFDSPERVEQVIERELPGIRDRVGEKVGTKIKRIEYRGVTSITANGMELSFAIFTQPWCYNYVKFAMTREVKLMCDRNNIRIALPHVVVQEPGPQAPADPE